jgi:hypothetical protein
LILLLQQEEGCHSRESWNPLKTGIDFHGIAGLRYAMPAMTGAFEPDCWGEEEIMNYGGKPHRVIASREAIRKINN